MNNTTASNETVAYLAALYQLKGKAFVRRGTLKWTKQMGRPLQGSEYRLELNHNDKEVLEDLLHKVDTKDDFTWFRQAYIGCRHGRYRLVLGGQLAYTLMKAILPYLIGKKADQLRDLLASEETQAPLVRSQAAQPLAEPSMPISEEPKAEEPKMLWLFAPEEEGADTPEAEPESVVASSSS